MLRSTLYAKNTGTIEENKNGLLRVDSPVSGHLLVQTTSVSRATRDPISGTVLKHENRGATVTAPAQTQQLLHSRKFHVQKDVDVTIQTLRNTTKISRYTNEKVGTSGTPTGVDRSLILYQEAQQQQMLQSPTV